VRLSSNNSADDPLIAPCYLTTEDDRRVAADSIRVTRKLMAHPALAQYRPEEILPGPSVLDDDEALAKAAGDIGTTIFHPVGTAKMGTDDDPMAVIDGQLRVRGVDGLRVIDASVMPTITSGNTNAQGRERYFTGSIQPARIPIGPVIATPINCNMKSPLF
jgi:choline dehydrogenase-like flavoprotein